MQTLTFAPFSKHCEVVLFFDQMALFIPFHSFFQRWGNLIWRHLVWWSGSVIGSCDRSSFWSDQSEMATLKPLNWNSVVVSCTAWAWHWAWLLSTSTVPSTGSIHSSVGSLRRGVTVTALTMSRTRTLVQMMAVLSVTCTVASILYYYSTLSLSLTLTLTSLSLIISGSIFPCEIPIKLQSFHATLQYTYTFYHVFTNSKTCLHWIYSMFDES